MSRKTFLTLAAVAALGIAALAPTSASAFRGGGNFGGGHFGGGHFGGGHFGGGHFGGGHFYAMSHGPVGHSHIGHSRFIGHRPFGHGPRFARGHFYHPCGFHHCGPRYGGWWRHYHRPYWVYPVGGAVVADTAAEPAEAAPVAGNPSDCNCLTKTYLPDGSVMFRDMCTKEAAVATPDELKAQAAGIPPAAEIK